MAGRIARRGGAALLFLVLLGWLALAVATRADAVRFSRVLSGSMEPTISTGSMVWGRPVAAGEIRAGQVVQFVPPAPYGPPGGGAVAHRVVDVERWPDGTVVVHTKGDANATADPWSLDATRSTVFRVVGDSALAGSLFDHGRRVATTVALCGLALLLAARALRALWRGGYRGAHRAPRTA
jgi:signal peptidase